MGWGHTSALPPPFCGTCPRGETEAQRGPRPPAPDRQGRAMRGKRVNRRRPLGDDLSPPLGLSLGRIQARTGLPARPSAAVSSAPSHCHGHVPRWCRCQAARSPSPPLSPPQPPPPAGATAATRGTPASPSTSRHGQATAGLVSYAVSVAPGFLPPAELARPRQRSLPPRRPDRPLVPARWHQGKGRGTRDASVVPLVGVICFAIRFCRTANKRRNGCPRGGPQVGDSHSTPQRGGGRLGGAVPCLGTGGRGRTEQSAQGCHPQCHQTPWAQLSLA